MELAKLNSNIIKTSIPLKQFSKTNTSDNQINKNQYNEDIKKNIKELTKQIGINKDILQKSISLPSNTNIPSNNSDEAQKIRATVNEPSSSGREDFKKSEYSDNFWKFKNKLDTTKIIVNEIESLLLDSDNKYNLNATKTVEEQQLHVGDDYIKNSVFGVYNELGQYLGKLDGPLELDKIANSEIAKKYIMSKEYEQELGNINIQTKISLSKQNSIENYNLQESNASSLPNSNASNVETQSPSQMIKKKRTTDRSMNINVEEIVKTTLSTLLESKKFLSAYELPTKESKIESKVEETNNYSNFMNKLEDNYTGKYEALIKPNIKRSNRFNEPIEQNLLTDYYMPPKNNNLNALSMAYMGIGEKKMNDFNKLENVIKDLSEKSIVGEVVTAKYVDEFVEDSFAPMNKLGKLSPTISQLINKSTVNQTNLITKDDWRKKDHRFVRLNNDKKRANSWLTGGQLSYYHSQANEEEQLDILNALLTCQKLEKILEEQHYVIDTLQNDLEKVRATAYKVPDALTNDQFINLLDLDAAMPSDYFELPDCTASFYTRLYSHQTSILSRVVAREVEQRMKQNLIADGQNSFNYPKLIPNSNNDLLSSKSIPYDNLYKVTNPASTKVLTNDVQKNNKASLLKNDTDMLMKTTETDKKNVNTKIIKTGSASVTSEKLGLNVNEMNKKTQVIKTGINNLSQVKGVPDNADISKKSNSDASNEKNLSSKPPTKVGQQLKKEAKDNLKNNLTTTKITEKVLSNNPKTVFSKPLATQSKNTDPKTIDKQNSSKMISEKQNVIKVDNKMDGSLNVKKGPIKQTTIKKVEFNLDANSDQHIIQKKNANEIKPIIKNVKSGIPEKFSEKQRQKSLSYEVKQTTNKEDFSKADIPIISTKGNDITLKQPIELSNEDSKQLTGKLTKDIGKSVVVMSNKANNDIKEKGTTLIKTKSPTSLITKQPIQNKQSNDTNQLKNGKEENQVEIKKSTANYNEINKRNDEIKKVNLIESTNQTDTANIIKRQASELNKSKQVSEIGKLGNVNNIQAKNMQTIKKTIENTKKVSDYQLNSSLVDEQQPTKSDSVKQINKSIINVKLNDEFVGTKQMINKEINDAKAIADKNSGLEFKNKESKSTTVTIENNNVAQVKVLKSNMQKNSPINLINTKQETAKTTEQNLASKSNNNTEKTNNIINTKNLVTTPISDEANSKINNTVSAIPLLKPNVIKISNKMQTKNIAKLKVLNIQAMEVAKNNGFVTDIFETFESDKPLLANPKVNSSQPKKLLIKPKIISKLIKS